MESSAGRGSPGREWTKQDGRNLSLVLEREVWLPHNVTWADLKNTEEATFPQAEDLYLAFPLAFCMLMVRLIFER